MVITPRFGGAYFQNMDKIEKYTVFRSQDNGDIYAIRNEPPRFTVKYLVGDNLVNNIEIMDIRDEWEVDPVEIAKLMRGIGEAIARFLQDELRQII